MKKDLAELWKKYKEIKSPQGQNMADGGKVENESSTFQDLADAFKRAFSTPKPVAPPPSNIDKYQKIREQNQKNVQDPENNPSANYYDPNMASGGIVGLQKVTQYAGGGDVKPNPSPSPSPSDDNKRNWQDALVEMKEAAGRAVDSLNPFYADGGAVDALPKPSPSPQSQEERDAESEEITKNEDARKLIADEEAKLFNKGGKVEHDKKNLLQLKKAFDKFFSEEGKEKLAAGGLVAALAKNYSRGGKVKKSKKMADGGEVDDSITKANDAIDKAHIRAYDPEGSPYIGVPNMRAESRMGDVQLDEQARKELQGRKAYADGGNVKPSPSPSPKPLSMGNLFDIPGEDKAADLVNQLPHFDEGGYAEASNAPAREMDLRQNVANSFGQSGHSATKNTESAPAPAATGDQPSIREFLGLNKGGMAGYAEGSLVEPNKFVDTQTPEEEAGAAKNVDNTGYAPEDYAAQQAADESTQGQLENELASDDKDELNNSPDELHDSPESDQDEADDAAAEDEDGNVEIDGDKEKENQDSALAALITAQKSPQNDLTTAQKQRDQAIQEQQIAKYGALAGAGMLGKSGINVNPSQALSVIDSGDKYVNMPVQKYEEQIANQQNDPNSPASQAMKQYMASKGFKIPDNASYADMIKIAPFMAKDAGLQNAMQRAVLSAQTKLLTNQNTVSAANDRAAKALEVKKQMAELAKQNKNAQDQARSLTQTQQLLESARGNPAAAQAEKDLYAAQKANSLYNLYGDPDKLSPQLVATMINEVAKISTGGVPTGHEQAALTPGTVESKLAELWGKVTNEPTAANAGAFLKQFKDYNDALSKDAQKVIQDKYGRIIETRKNQLGPDNYQSLQDNYINRFKPATNDIPVDADLTKMTDKQLQDYIKLHGAQ